MGSFRNSTMIEEKHSCSELKVESASEQTFCLEIADAPCFSGVDAFKNGNSGFVNSGTVALASSERLLEDNYRINGVLLDGMNGEIDTNKFGTDGLHLEEAGDQVDFEASMCSVIPSELFVNGNCVHDELKDEKIISGSSIGVVIEDSGHVLGGIGTGSLDQIVSLQGCEMPSELLTFNCSEQEKHEGDDLANCLLLERYPDVSGNSDSSIGMKADGSYLNACSQHAEMSLEMLPGDDLVGEGDLEYSEKEGESTVQISADATADVLEAASDISRGIQIFHSQLYPNIVDDRHMVQSDNNTRYNEQRDDTIACGPTAEINTQDLEEMKDVHKFDRCNNIRYVEGNACSVNEDSLATASVVKKSSCLQPCTPSVIVNIGFSKSLDVPEFSENDVTKPTYSTGVVDCCEQTDCKAKSNGTDNRSTIINCPNMVLSSSCRRCQVSKSSVDIQTNKTKCRKTSKVVYANGSTEVIHRAPRRKRSCIYTPARPSIWGSLDNILPYFEESTFLQKGLEQEQGSRGSGKKNKNRGGRGIPDSKGTCGVSSSRIRLKVRIGNQVLPSSLNMITPVVVGSSPPAISSKELCGNASGATLEIPNLVSGTEDNVEDEGYKNLVKEKTLAVSGLLNVLPSKDLESTIVLDKSDGDDYSEVPSQRMDGSSFYENMRKDPGTSPDSEVINSTPDAQASCKHHENSPNTAPVDFTYNRRKMKDKVCHGEKCIMKDRSTSPAGTKKVKHSKRCRCRPKLEGDIYSAATVTSSATAKGLGISPRNKELPTGVLSSSRETKFGVSDEALAVESNIEGKTDCSRNVGPGLPGSHDSDNLCPSTNAKGNKSSKSLKSGGSKDVSKATDSARSVEGSACTKSKQPRKSVNKSKAKGNVAYDSLERTRKNHLQSGNHIVSDAEKAKTCDNNASVDVSNLDMVSTDIVQQNILPHQAWVCCDDCNKWRRIPAMLVEAVGSNYRWVCKDGMDNDFADCSIPQEKSNAEINAELELSDDSCEEYSDAPRHYTEFNPVHSKVRQTGLFTYIPTNEFLQRKRKTQTIDEIMVCYCKPDRNGRLGCRDECLNRLLNIECVQGTCPCGEFCSNQRFQKHNYAKLNWFRSGKKGYGLQLLEDIRKGQFLIEYVGEVLDIHTYEARQKMYASDGHKHFYFMTLNGGEVIDACAKGNLGRFINHSCDPNCRTEKWMVNGEICIGLFALRDIRKGEELTFDYNYVRVFGAAAKRCYCGSSQCRGYIGGDPLNSEEIVHGDSDEEFPEPVMLSIDGETGDVLESVITQISSVDVAEMQSAESILKDRHKMDELEITAESEDSINKFASVISQSQDSIREFRSDCIVETSLQTEDEKGKPVSVNQDISLEEDIINKKKSSAIAHPSARYGKLSSGCSNQSNTVDDKPVSSKPHPRVKTSRSSSLAKKGKVCAPLNCSKPSAVNKFQMPSIKTKRVEGSSAACLEGVEAKLNELLDADGGVCRRKDAPKGYLKLLLLTAASGDGFSGEAIQSNRDLSMILDALLKTKSRGVLNDIIKKNGLQMLHKMMKQYRKDFLKKPILRKLLKVLEYLALREILTPEHINGGPPCPGMESFRDSILSLTEHDDKQVHQIARNFRNRWIPRHLRKINCMDREDGRMELGRDSSYNRPSTSHGHWHDHSKRLADGSDCVQQTEATTRLTTTPDTGVREGSYAPCTGGPTTGTRKRKFKSRWDQPAESNTESRSLQHNEPTTNSERGDVGLGHANMVKRDPAKIYGYEHDDRKKDEAVKADDGLDVPPGFSSPVHCTNLPSNALSSDDDFHKERVSQMTQSDVVIAYPQERFISRLPVSYGIPLSIVHQFGAHPEGKSNNWLVAPGMPFHPFPPLPPFPVTKPDPFPPHFVNPVTVNQPARGQLRALSPNGTNQVDRDYSSANNQHMHKRQRGSSCDLGQRYFRQQKWNNPNLPQRSGKGMGVGSGEFREMGPSI